MRKSSRLLMSTMLLLSLLLAVPLTLAQEEAAEASAAAPGIGAGVFLMGVLAVLAVGITMIARDSFKSDSDESH